MKTEQEQLKKSLRGEKTKELIIDCINVNECEFYGYDGICKLYSGSNCSKDCSNYPNCNYKQLKRKEQECEELKTILQTSDIVKAVISSAEINFPIIEKLSNTLNEIERIADSNLCDDDDDICPDNCECDWKVVKCVINKAKEQ